MFMVILFKPNVENFCFCWKCLEKIKLTIVKMRMFDIHKDIWSLGFPFILYIIHIHFNIVLTFQIEPKQGNVKNVNRFKE